MCVCVSSCESGTCMQQAVSPAASRRRGEGGGGWSRSREDRSSFLHHYAVRILSSRGNDNDDFVGTGRRWLGAPERTLMALIGLETGRSSYCRLTCFKPGVL